MLVKKSRLPSAGVPVVSIDKGRRPIAKRISAKAAPAVERGAKRRAGASVRKDTRVDDPMAWIGQEVKSLRKAKGLSLQQMATSCGKSIGFLSQVERGLSKPTISDLHDIAATLGVQISWFFPQGDACEPADGGVVVRKARRRQLSFASGIADYLLSPSLAGPLEILWSVMEPGADSGHAYDHVGDEAGVVIRGTLELWVGDRFFILQEGDSFSFASTMPHRYRNPGDADTELFWVVTPPSY